MTEILDKPGYSARHIQDVEPTPCPCGESIRIFTAEESPNVGFHITHIKDSKRHYHKKTTEIYYILEGSGVLEVGGDTLSLRPGMSILIKPGTPHRGYGDFKTIVVPQPAFDPEDEFIIDEDSNS